jgi:serine/threonine-protein kinase RsbW
MNCTDGVLGTRRVTEAPGRPDPRVIVDDVAHATATAIATGKVQWIDSRDPQGGEPAPAAAGRHTSDRVAVASPLRARGTVLGALTILARESGSFRDADLSFLDDLTYRCALAFENARLYEHERDTAHVLQQSLLTGEPPDDPRIEVATRYLPGTANLAVGGDWYDSLTVTGSRIGIVVGDVVGRGINAASTMGQLRSATRALAGAQLGPARMLEHLDRFVDRLDAGQMATLVYAEICLDTGVMRYACAGHPPPVLIEKAREPQILWGGRSMPLGIDIGDNERTDAELVLRPGARLLLYTDGLVETRTASITDGIARLVKELSQHREQPPAALLRTLTDAMLHGHQGDDDVCLLCLSFNGPEAVRRTRSG